MVMMDLSRQQRWLIMMIIGALILGGFILLTRRSETEDKNLYVLEVAGSKATQEHTVAEDEDSPEDSQLITGCYVHVCGEVKSPGVYCLPPETRKFQALDAAGGMTAQADSAALNLASKIVDGEQIFVPKRRSQSQAESRNAGTNTAKDFTPQKSWPLDLNIATAEELDSVPGIGPKMAGDILAFRRENGRFSSLEQLTEVPGIGEKRLASLRQYLCVR
jgi:competence protein ComEA